MALTGGLGWWRLKLEAVEAGSAVDDVDQDDQMNNKSWLVYSVGKGWKNYPVLWGSYTKPWNKWNKDPGTLKPPGWLMESKGPRVLQDRGSDGSRVRIIRWSFCKAVDPAMTDQQVFYLTKNCDLGGGFKHFLSFHPMIQFDQYSSNGWFNHQPVMETWAIFFSDLLVEVTVPNCSFFVRERTSMGASPYPKMAETFRLRIYNTLPRYLYKNLQWLSVCINLRYTVYIFLVTCQTKKTPYWRGIELLHPHFCKCRTEMMKWAQMSKAEWPELSTYTHGIHGTGIFTYMNDWFSWDQCR